MTAWFLIMSILIYSGDDGSWHRQYQVRDQAFPSQEECEVARYHRTHNDYFDGDLQTACVEVTLLPKIDR